MPLTFLNICEIRSIFYTKSYTWECC